MTEDIKLKPSEMELIHQKSIDPDFLKECDVMSRKTYELNEEREYNEMWHVKGWEGVKMTQNSMIKKNIDEINKNEMHEVDQLVMMVDTQRMLIKILRSRIRELEV